MDFSKVTFVTNYWSLLLPCIFMCSDIISGIIKACYTESFESKMMRKGLLHKAGELIVLILFVVSQVALGLPKYIATFIEMYIVLMEGYSICENLNDIGVPIPSFIKKTLKDTTDKMDKGKEVE